MGGNNNNFTNNRGKSNTEKKRTPIDLNKENYVEQAEKVI